MSNFYTKKCMYCNILIADNKTLCQNCACSARAMNKQPKINPYFFDRGTKKKKKIGIKQKKPIEHKLMEVSKDYTPLIIIEDNKVFTTRKEEFLSLKLELKKRKLTATYCIKYRNSKSFLSQKKHDIDNVPSDSLRIYSMRMRSVLRDGE